MKKHLLTLLFLVLAAMVSFNLFGCIEVDSNRPLPEQKEYTISYVLDGGVNHPLNPDSYYENGDIVLLNNPSKAGYKFVGWHLDSQTGEIINTINRGTNRDVTLYAEWISDDKLDIKQEAEMIGNTGLVTWTIINKGEYFNESIFIRFQGTNLDKSLELSNYVADGLSVTATEVTNEGEFLGYDVVLSIAKGETLTLTADATAAEIKSYTLKTLTINSTSSSLEIKPKEDLAITQEFVNDKLTINVLNNGASYKGKLFVRTKGTNVDKTLTLSNFLANGVSIEAKEVYAEDERFLGYDLEIELKPNESIEISAEAEYIANREYRIQTLTANCHSSSLSFLVEDKLDIKQELVGNTLTITIKNLGVDYLGSLMIRTKGSNTDKSLTMKEFMLGGALVEAKEAYAEDGRFLGYDLDINALAGEEIVLTATVDYPLNRAYVLHTLSAYSHSSTLNIEAIEEKLDITEEVTNDLFTLTVKNKGLTYKDGLSIRFQGTNDDKSLTLSNFFVNGKEIKVTEKYAGKTFLGYDLDVIIEEGETLVITATVNPAFDKEYKFKTVSVNCESSTFILPAIRINLSLEQSLSNTDYSLTITNNGYKYNGEVLISFLGTNNLKGIELTDFSGEVKEVLKDGILVGYAVTVDLDESEVLVITAKVKVNVAGSYKVQACGEAQDSTVEVLVIKEDVDILQGVTQEEFTLTVKNNGAAYTEGFAIRFQGSNTDK